MSKAKYTEIIFPVTAAFQSTKRSSAGGEIIADYVKDGKRYFVIRNPESKPKTRKPKQQHVIDRSGTE